MAEIKATEEFFQARGMSRDLVIAKIKSGEIKGKIVGASILIDESELPESMKQKTDAKIELNTPPYNERQKILDNVELIKAQTALAEATIKLELAQRKRDEPETLASIAKALDNRKLELDKLAEFYKSREESIVLKEHNLSIREQTLINNETILNQKISTADTEIQQKRDLADSLNLQLSQEDDRITKEITRKKLELETLKTTIEQVKKEAEPVVSWLTKWANWTNGQASKLHVQKNYDQANALLQKSDALTKLKQKLGF